MLPESEYYTFVEQFISSEFSCIKTGINKGYLGLGIVDVAGVAEVGNDIISNVELIFVEVKTSNKCFGKSIGQALGYSIYGERCYLGVTFEQGQSFSKEQEYMANHLGVGLICIEVKGDGTPSSIHIVNSSKKHTPIQSQKHYLLHSIGVAQCNLCRRYDLLVNMNSIISEKPVQKLFSSNERSKLYLCKKCFDWIVPDREKKLLAHRRETAKKAVESRIKNRKVMDVDSNSPGEKAGK